MLLPTATLGMWDRDIGSDLGPYSIRRHLPSMRYLTQARPSATNSDHAPEWELYRGPITGLANLEMSKSVS